MASPPFVLSDVLCFVVNKYGRTATKTLTSALFDFYTVDLLSDAKSRLLEDSDKMNLSVKHPYVPSRRDCNERLEREVNDIMLLLNFSDEQKVLDKLPTYVSSNPDNMPSLRLYDGDMNVIMRKHNEIDARLSEIGSTLAAIVQEVRALQAVRPPVSSRMTGGSELGRDVNISTAGCAAAGYSAPGASGNYVAELTENETGTTADYNQPTTARNWAMISSTPSQRDNRFAVLSADTDDDHDSQTFQVVQGRRAAKRLRQQSSLNTHSSQQQEQQKRQQNMQQTAARRSQTVHGNASVVRGNSITAAKVIRQRAVLCVDNVSTDYTADDVRAFVGHMGINVVSCFEVQPRKRRNIDYDRKAFRLCIFKDDRERVLDEAAWPDSVVVSDWFFKSSKEGTGRRQPVQTTATSAMGSAVSTAPQQSSSTAAAPDIASRSDLSATGVGATVANQDDNDMMTASDETIIAAAVDNFTTNDGC